MNIFRSMHQYLHKINHRKKCIFGKNVVIDKNFECEGGNKIFHDSTVLNTKIGYGTYIADASFIANSDIGRFCCIARDVRTVSGNHPSSKFVSIHPAFYSILKQSGFTFVDKNIFEDNKFYDVSRRKAVKIGNDVWIGEGVRIMEGINISDGAIIAAGAIITKDVPPYSIVGGIPAKIIRRRFSEEDIEWLNNFRWWDRDINWIKTNAGEFEDIAKLKKLRD